MAWRETVRKELGMSPMQRLATGHEASEAAHLRTNTHHCNPTIGSISPSIAEALPSRKRHAEEHAAAAALHARRRKLRPPPFDAGVSARGMASADLRPGTSKLQDASENATPMRNRYLGINPKCPDAPVKLPRKALPALPSNISRQLF